MADYNRPGRSEQSTPVHWDGLRHGVPGFDRVAWAAKRPTCPGSCHSKVGAEQETLPRACLVNLLTYYSFMVRSAAQVVRMMPDGEESDLRRFEEEDISESVGLEVLERYPDKRMALLHNRRLPISILRILAADADFRVRRAVAQHPGLDAQLIEVLSIDDYPGVRLMLLFNPVVDSKTLLLMVRADPWSDLRRIGMKRLTTHV